MPAGWITVLANGALIVCALTAAAVIPPSNGEVAVFLAPWSHDPSAVEVVARAGGSLVAVGRPWAAIAVSEDPHFVTHLYEAGAFLVTAPALAAGCTEAIHRS
jgi:hypothetical protein